MTKMEVEIEKGCTKARYSLMNDKDKNVNVQNDGTNEHGHEHNDENSDDLFNATGKTANYANLRVTDLPTVQRLYPPKPAKTKR